MPVSAKSLHASGSISDKQMAKLQVLRGTKHQKSKMADFNDRTKDEGHQAHVGARGYSVNEINEKSQQKKGKYGRVSKHGGAMAHGQPKVNAINDGSMQHPKFPAGGKLGSHKAGLRVPSKAKGTIAPTGPIYGGGGRSTQ